MVREHRVTTVVFEQRKSKARAPNQWEKRRNCSLRLGNRWPGARREGSGTPAGAMVWRMDAFHRWPAVRRMRLVPAGVASASGAAVIPWARTDRPMVRYVARRIVSTPARCACWTVITANTMRPKPAGRTSRGTQPSATWRRCRASRWRPAACGRRSGSAPRRGRSASLRASGLARAGWRRTQECHPTEQRPDLLVQA